MGASEHRVSGARRASPSARSSNVCTIEQCMHDQAMHARSSNACTIKQWSAMTVYSEEEMRASRMREPRGISRMYAVIPMTAAETRV